MNSGRTLATMALVAALGSPVGDAVAQTAGGVLRIFQHESPPSASIHEEATGSTVIPFMAVFNNLVVFDQQVAQNSDRSIVPDLARSWTWNSEMTELTFKLRDDVTWHDGVPFAARDVVCTFDLLADKPREKLRRNPRKEWYRNVDFVDARGTYEVTLHLSRPQPSLLSMLASGYSPIYPCHVPPSQMRTRPIGTGPFKLASYREYQSVILVRNPDYWKKGKPLLDGIEFTISSNAATAILSFAVGRFEMTTPWQLTADELRVVRQRAPEAQCETTSMNLNVNLLINRTARPFDNADLRRAVTLAIDREAFVEALGRDVVEIGSTMQPPRDGLWGLPADALAALPGYGADVEKNRGEARVLMSRLGYGPDKRLTLKLITRGTSIYTRAAPILVDQLKDIYIDAQLDIVETARWFPRLAGKDYALALNATGNAIDDPDQTLYENFACGSVRNYTGYCNRDVEKMFDAQSTETDPQKRRRLVHEIDARLLADGARPPIVWKLGTTCLQPYVKGYVFMVNSVYNGFRFEDVWLDKPRPALR